ncbi:MAG: DNA (cytosine-5-)-methyltransferase [Candidatus Thermoplasmatota archaeon]
MPLRVVELFAGVGGFRRGLEDANAKVFETVWWNQWEPATKIQHAWNCYIAQFPTPKLPVNTNTDICRVEKSSIRDHDLLVGGFPCQDYSVATTLDKSGGLQGKKGVLWWEIEKTLKAKRPPYVLLENVDRLLKSPAKKRGRDFAVLLACFWKYDYAVEWRVLNAADYGNAQRRRRVFIFAAHKSTGIGKQILGAASDAQYLQKKGFFAGAFPTSYEVIAAGKERPAGRVVKDPRKTSASYDKTKPSAKTSFQNAGVMAGGKVWTIKVTPRAEPQAVLAKHLFVGAVEPRYFLDKSKLAFWEFQKGAKSIKRVANKGTKDEFEYLFQEGGMQFPDLPGSPARTILTSEGNRTPNRSTHVVDDPKTGEKRFLLPEEVEKLMGFPPGWTESLPERWRYFTMGNALVVPLVTRLGSHLIEWIKKCEDQASQEALLGKPRKKEERPIRTHS